MKACLAIGSAPAVTFLAVVMFAWSYVGQTVPACAGSMTFEYVVSSDCVYQQPHNTALSPDGRYLYVPEVRRHRIVVLDAASLAYVNEFGRGDLQWPHDVSIGPDNQLYVADSGNDRIAIFDLDGTTATFKSQLKGDFENPEGVFAHPNGRVFVSGEDSGSVVVFENQTALNTIKGLNRPHGIGLADDGGVWVAMAGNNKLLNYDAELRPTGREVNEPLAGPRYMALSADDHIFLAEKQGHTIAVLSASGEVVARLGSGAPGFGRGVFNGPEGIAVRDGSIWVTDTSNGRIVRYRVHKTENKLATGSLLRPSTH
ncbi:MAG: hypothetical protein HKN11_16965 [Rhizobiales bacterium]|nr:hypothetical protein [Hyphomicrobiales bacterium]